MANYYHVKLNIPLVKADVIKALVPDGKPVAGALLDILLDVAEQRGVAEPDVETMLALQKRMEFLETKLSKVTKRLNEVTALATGARR